MPDLSQEIFDALVKPGPRLPWLGSWLLDSVWTRSRYTSLGAVEFLKQGEKQVNDLEEVMAVAAPRVYDELLSAPTSDRDVHSFLT